MVRMAMAIASSSVPKMLQWSHVFSDMVSRLESKYYPLNISSFNGAMSFQTW